MLSRSVNILLYFSKWSYQIVNELVVKGTPRAGHPLKEGLRQKSHQPLQDLLPPRAGHPLKEGLRHLSIKLMNSTLSSQSGSSTKRGIKTFISFYVVETPKNSQSGSSTKRGIKTLKNWNGHSRKAQSGSSTKRGIKTQPCAIHGYNLYNPERVIH